MPITGGDCDGYSAGARVGIALAVVALLLLLYVVYLQREEAADAAAAVAVLTGGCPPCQEGMTSGTDGWVHNPHNVGDAIFSNPQQSGCGRACAELKFRSRLSPELCRDTCLRSNNCTHYKSNPDGSCDQLKIAIGAGSDGGASGCRDLVPKYCGLSKDPQACIKKNLPNCQNLAFASDTVLSTGRAARFPPTWVDIPGASGVWKLSH